MNERIKQLAEQAHEYSCAEYTKRLETETADQIFFNKIFNQKFAELIVKECIRVPYDMWDKAELNADVAVKIEHRIKEHFGVEE